MAEKKYRDENWLHEQYVENNHTVSEIGEMCGVTGAAISKWLRRHSIETRDPGVGRLDTKPYKDEDWLREQYVEKERPASSIAQEFDISPSTVYHWMDEFGIEAREVSEAQYLRALRAPPRYFTRPDGYEAVHSDVRGRIDRVFVHRLVAVAEYGFEDVCGEVVHHKNGVKWDNRPENLEVMSLAEHGEHHAQDRDRTKEGVFV